jgi:hypothetical protein
VESVGRGEEKKKKCGNCAEVIDLDIKKIAITYLNLRRVW